MLKLKLGRRGYNLRTLQKSFLKFCSAYPAPSKYGVHDGTTLWDQTVSHELITSCYLYDHDAVKKLTKECSVVLKDLFPLKMITPLNDSSTIVDAENSISNPDLEMIIISTTQSDEPIGLFNPAEHCYLNAVLQILFRLREIDVGPLNINNCNEGRIVKALYDGFKSKSSVNLSQFKIDLATHNSFFDGMTQRDAHECFVSIVNILHEGTKSCLIDMDVSSDSLESLTNSYPKALFHFTLRKSFTCRNCQEESSSYSQSSTINVYPAISSRLCLLVDNCLTGTLIRFCKTCNLDTSHHESLSFDDPPKVLTILVNRFEYNRQSKKLKTSITIDKHLNIGSGFYNLCGFIEHHGDSLSSGHYTSRLFYSDSAYLCDDHYISKFNPSIDVNSKLAYLIFYARVN